MEGDGEGREGYTRQKVEYPKWSVLEEAIPTSPTYQSGSVQLGAIPHHSHENLDVVRVSGHGGGYGEDTGLQHRDQVKQVWEGDLRASAGEVLKDLRRE